MNIFRTVVDSGRLVIPDADFALPITSGVQKLVGSRKELKLGIRPWGIRVSQTQTTASVPGKVTVVEDLGDETRVGVRYGEILIMSSIPVTRRYRPGLPVYLTFNDEDLNLFDSVTGERLSENNDPSHQATHETADRNEIRAPVTR
jgi:ABC-type sugar transport system ATPase subunit